MLNRNPTATKVAQGAVIAALYVVLTMPFATDTDDAVNSIVGGTGTLPQTIVLNRRGEVIYNQIGSVTPEVLAALYDEADK